MKKILIKLSDFYLIIVILALISAFISYYNYVFGIISFLLLIYSVIFIFFYSKRKNEEYLDDIEQNKASLSNTASEVVYKMPFPMAVLNNKGLIKWYSPNFVNLFSSDDIIGINIANKIDSFNITNVLRQRCGSFIWENERLNYIVYYNVVKDKNNGDINIVIYLIDNLKYSKLEKKYDDSKSVSYTHLTLPTTPYV